MFSDSQLLVIIYYLACYSVFIVSSVPWSILSSFALLLCQGLCCLHNMPIDELHHRGDYSNFPPTSLCLRYPTLSGRKLQLEHNDVTWLLMPYSFPGRGLPTVCLWWFSWLDEFPSPTSYRLQKPLLMFIQIATLL